jgi:aminoglycoside phosphotransferase (APT) family kinase protein
MYEKLIRKIFFENLKVKRLEISDLTKGLEHKVFNVKTESNDYIIKFPITSSDNKCKVQQWAYKKWTNIGIPVPKVILYNHNYIIEEKIQGVDLEEAKLSLEQQQEIMYQLGKLVRKMHSIKTTGFGPIGSNYKGKYRTWKQFINTQYKKAFLEAKKNRYLPSNLLNKIQTFYNERMDVLDYSDPILFHNDLVYSNIIVKDGKITGIIDAGDCLSGDPLFEFGFMNWYYFKKKVMDHFYKGYGAIDERKVQFYTIIDAIPNGPDVEIILEKMIDVIKYYLE